MHQLELVMKRLAKAGEASARRGGPPLPGAKQTGRTSGTRKPGELIARARGRAPKHARLPHTRASAPDFQGRRRGQEQGRRGGERKTRERAQPEKGRGLCEIALISSAALHELRSHVSRLTGSVRIVHCAEQIIARRFPGASFNRPESYILIDAAYQFARGDILRNRTLRTVRLAPRRCDRRAVWPDA